MAKLVQPPPKFVHPEWTMSNQMKYANAEGERAASERLIEESKRVCDDTDDTTKKAQRDVNHKLNQRIEDIKYWNSEVDNKLDAVKTEIDNLVAFKTRLEKALEATREPLHIAQQCLINRQNRTAIDLVHDDAEKELLKEVETIQGAQALLSRTLEQAEEQLRINRKAKFNLEKDLKDKFSALSIDEHNAELRNNSAEIGFRGDVAKIAANSSTPDDWENFSDTNIIEAEKTRMNSVSLRSLIDGILQQTSNDMLKQKECVDIAMTKRIAEARDTKQKLEDHLSKVLGQIQEMEDNIERLSIAIENKKAPLQVSETRLDNRAQRPNVELCRDDVQYRLVQEVGQLNQSVATLSQKLAESESSLKGLIRRQLDLEEDIEVKSNSLFIDETQCMGMRNSINIQIY